MEFKQAPTVSSATVESITEDMSSVKIDDGTAASAPKSPQPAKKSKPPKAKKESATIAIWKPLMAIDDTSVMESTLDRFVQSATLSLSPGSPASRVLSYVSHQLQASEGGFVSIPVGSLSTELALCDSDLDMAVVDAAKLKRISKAFNDLHHEYSQRFDNLFQDLQVLDSLRSKNLQEQHVLQRRSLVPLQESLPPPPQIKTIKPQPRAVFVLAHLRVPLIKLMSFHHTVPRLFSFSGEQPLPPLLQLSSSIRERPPLFTLPLSPSTVSPLQPTDSLAARIQHHPFPIDVKVLNTFDLAKVLNPPSQKSNHSPLNLL